MATVKLWTDDRRGGRTRASAKRCARCCSRSATIRRRHQCVARPGKSAAVLEHIRASLKEVMVAAGVIDPLTKELIYIAVSTLYGGSYCVHSHTAAARAKGMPREQYAERLGIIGMAAETNALVTAMHTPLDAEYVVGD